MNTKRKHAGRRTRKNKNAHLFFTTLEAAWYIISVVSVCIYVCQTITFESLDIRRSYLHRCISEEYGSSSYMKVIGLRSRSQEKKVENEYSRNIKLQAAVTTLL